MSFRWEEMNSQGEGTANRHSTVNASTMNTSTLNASTVNTSTVNTLVFGDWQDISNWKTPIIEMGCRVGTSQVRISYRNRRYLAIGTPVIRWRRGRHPLRRP